MEYFTLMFWIGIVLNVFQTIDIPLTVIALLSDNILSQQFLNQ